MFGNWMGSIVKIKLLERSDNNTNSIHYHGWGYICGKANIYI